MVYLVCIQEAAPPPPVPTHTLSPSLLSMHLQRLVGRYVTNHLGRCWQVANNIEADSWQVPQMFWACAISVNHHMLLAHWRVAYVICSREGTTHHLVYPGCYTPSACCSFADEVVEILVTIGLDKEQIHQRRFLSSCFVIYDITLKDK